MVLALLLFPGARFGTPRNFFIDFSAALLSHSRGLKRISVGYRHRIYREAHDFSTHAKVNWEKFC
jgi:hypothetical protein